MSNKKALEDVNRWVKRFVREDGKTYIDLRLLEPETLETIRAALLYQINLDKDKEK